MQKMKGQGMAPIQGRPHSYVRHMVQTEVCPAQVQYQEHMSATKPHSVHMLLIITMP